ncbi:hypothetical protein FJW04_19100 [Mesorhizobium sp. B2-7-3]|uniref:hypothetical protein n=1 Tax=Mesorhizobium sp. B2-7-3 TaxID=2589907 RepID=UPI00112C2991|nr:hypothetical protein [Mesorhizobium sp. B2-7-3]TPJ13723.1 hypothetical protein FJW04_19100 [Mesorhizobium sp. B2-7-3]
MVTRVRRTGEREVTVTFKFPINATARAMVDSQIALLRDCVVPIVGATARLQPYVVGSAVLLDYFGTKCLVTAEHVMSDHGQEPLFLFGADGLSRPLHGQFEVDEDADLAVKLLSDEERNWLSHRPFLPASSLDRVAPPGERFYATVVGYPASAARRLDKMTLDTRMEAYSNFAAETADGRVEVLFDKKEGVRGERGDVQARDQYGKSGGAIFGIALSSSFGLPVPPAKLVGIATRWKRVRNQICGSGCSSLVPLLDALMKAVHSE